MTYFISFKNNLNKDKGEEVTKDLLVYILYGVAVGLIKLAVSSKARNFLDPLTK